mmetsp:Transcript_29381/g.74913  ORF Transcript_29381/g.74913 Transcript_29381/m.74913 type:complete len:254 (+) Transcript_29381:190-951(+)
MAKTPELLSIGTSPWSLKARWALKHHGISYRTTPYQPVLGELWLRWRLGKWRGRVSVPVLFLSNGSAIDDSYSIVCWADDHGAHQGATKLVPQEHSEAVARFNQLSDTILFFGRQQLLQLCVESAEARKPFLPPFLPSWTTDWLVRTVCGRVLAKYSAESSRSSKQQVVQALEEVRAALQNQGGSTATASGSAAGGRGSTGSQELLGRYLVGGAFSHADIAVAAALQFVKPVGPPYNKSKSGVQPPVCAELAA